MRATRNKLPQRLSGIDGLLAAVIATAVNDFTAGNTEQRKDALDYFTGKTYREHLVMLDLSEHTIPDALAHVLEWRL